MINNASTLSENAQPVLTYVWHDMNLYLRWLQCVLCKDNRKHSCQTNIGKKEVNNQHYNASSTTTTPRNNCMENHFAWDRLNKSFIVYFYHYLWSSTQLQL